MAESKTSSKIIIIQSSDSALWDTFVSKSPQGTFFHSSIWANILQKTFHRNYNIICSEKNGQIVGGMIFFKHRKFFWNVITPTPLFPYTGPIFYQPSEEKRQKTTHNELTIASQFDTYLNNNYDYWILDVPATRLDMRAFQWQGALVEPRYSYRISLDNIDELINNLSQSVRKKIKQSESLDCEITEAKNPEKLIELLSHSYNRHGVKPYIANSTLQTLLDNALKLPQLKLYHMKIDGEIKAARLIVVDTDIIYDLLAGSDDPSGIGSTSLVFYILKKYLPTHTYFDFMGADHPQIEKFKRGFGGELVQGFRVTNKVKRPLSWLVNFNQSRTQKKRKL